MNPSSFLTCLSYEGVNTGISVLGLYSFSSGTTTGIYNQIYTTGYNLFSGYPYDPALPLVYNGPGNQPSGNFSKSGFYQISKSYTGDFSCVLNLNYSGCLNSGNTNYLLASSIPNASTSSSGAILGITPSSRLFLNTLNYSYTLPKEIGVGDFAYFSVQKNRFIDFGVFDIRNNLFYRKSYDAGSASVDVQGIYLGGMLNYPQTFTGYSGIINEFYLFSGNLQDASISSCVDCAFSTGYISSQPVSSFTGIQITGSSWSGVTQNQITGYKQISGTYLKYNGTTGIVYYNSGLSGNVSVYQSLVPLTQNVTYSLTGSGISSILYNDSQRLQNIIFDAYFDLGLVSGDFVEVYTYPRFNSNIGNYLSYNSTFPSYSGLVQIYGNGLAETNGVDYNVLFNSLISGFDSNDILLYDIGSTGYTMPYTTGYISTGVSGAGYINITGISGINLASGFNYDFYLNGQKLISGINYSISGTGINVSGNDLADINDPNNDFLEAKFIPFISGVNRTLYQITGASYTITGITGFSEQIWINGLRSSINVDYYKNNPCRFCTGNFGNPNYNFGLYNSVNDTVGFFNLFRYGPSIVTSGLVLLLDATDLNSYIVGGNTWIDLSNNNNNATIINGGYNSANNGSISFNGATSYASPPINIDYYPDTISAWFYPIVTSPTMSIVTSDNGGYDKGFGINGNQWMINDGSGNFFAGTATANNWYNGTVVYETGDVKLYINSNLVYSKGSGQGFTVGANLQIGRAWYPNGAGSRFFSGYISNVSVYNRALSSGEVLQNYNAIKSRYNL